MVGELLQGTALALGPTAVEELSGMFAGQAVARSPSQWISTLYLHGLDQLDALSWQWINQHENLVEQVLAHTAGNLPTQTSTGRERRSHAWPVKVHLYALFGCVTNV